MLRLFTLFLSLSLSVVSQGQTGTMADPFTSLGLALTVGSEGTYYFNIGGTAFDTYVDLNGYVIVAIDFGNGIGDLPQGTSLNLSTRGILNPTVLSSLTTQTEIRISSSTGNIDVTTSNATLLSRITSNNTLHTGTVDNGINNTWTGTGAVYFTNDATSTSLTANDLHQRIFHPSGNTGTFHWQPIIDQQREIYTSGEIAAGESLYLWVRDNSSSLPVQLLNFNAIPMNQEVVLKWKTASELNNDFFTIQRSRDGINWNNIKFLDGAGNSSDLIEYSSIDKAPLLGISYYRLKQTDFDGQSDYSQIVSVNYGYNSDNYILIYPNPAISELNLITDFIEFNKIKVYNILGQEVTQLVKITEIDNGKFVLDLSTLSSGYYCIMSKTTVNKVYKQ